MAEVTLEAQTTKWLLVAIYGDPARTNYPGIWQQIHYFIKSRGLPTCVIGDFNEVMSREEKWRGSSQFSQPNRAFRDWIRDDGLVDLGHVGPAYTWSNGQDGRASISQQLDRVLATVSWTMLYFKAAVFHLPHFNSDHLPILLRTNPARTRDRKDFKCENWWPFKEGFKEMCEQVVTENSEDWSGFRRNFIKRVKTWAGTDVTPQRMLQDIEERMLLLNSAEPGSVPTGVDKKLQEKRATCLQMLEYYWHQWSRIKWAIFGDGNTKFFHASTVSRNRRNAIRAL